VRSPHGREDDPALERSQADIGRGRSPSRRRTRGPSPGARSGPGANTALGGRRAAAGGRDKSSTGCPVTCAAHVAEKLLRVLVHGDDHAVTVHRDHGVAGRIEQAGYAGGQASARGHRGLEYPAPRRLSSRGCGRKRSPKHGGAGAAPRRSGRGLLRPADEPDAHTQVLHAGVTAPCERRFWEVNGKW
jgi:hypothetical protein